MACWLVKGDPGVYGAADLQREKRTIWDGVTNPLAQRHLGSMAMGDQVLIYHTGAEKLIVAKAQVSCEPEPDPKDKTGRATRVEIAFVDWLETPVQLTAIKRDGSFADFDLVRNSRLSVMPVTKAHWAAILKLSKAGSTSKSNAQRKTRTPPTA